MKKQPTKKSLMLRTEKVRTLQALTNDDLRAVVGGRLGGDDTTSNETTYAPTGHTSNC